MKREAPRQNKHKSMGEGMQLAILFEPSVRKEAPEKVTGQARYAADKLPAGTLCARLLTSPVAHGALKGIDISQAEASPGVVKVLVGSDREKLVGVLLEDRPPLAVGKVRYLGEQVAMVIAQDEAQAEAAVRKIQLNIEELPVVDTVEAALRPGAPILHPDAGDYACLVDDVAPQQNSNIAARFSVRKGDLANAWAQCAAQVKRHFSLPHSCHAAMEARTAQAELRADGTLWILSATQSPYTVRELVSGAFDIEPGKVVVETALVGGGFGGKSAVMLEFLAAMAARAVPGRRVHLVLTREQDLISAPDRLALEADIRLGAAADGRLLAGEMTFYLDCGAYSDISPNMSKAIAVDATGPYRLDNLLVESMTVYTNHTYATAYRGFGHESCAFCVERALDLLADQLNMDPLALREVNAIQPGNYTPTQVECNRSNTGNLSECLSQLRALTGWSDARPVTAPNGKVRARGVSCFWKTPNPSTDASASATITFNPDGSANLHIGVVEMGNGGITTLCRMAAERLRMPYDRVHAELDVNTRTTPEYWKTVASLSSFLGGKAVLSACDDAVTQLKAMAAIALRCGVEDLDYGEQRVFLKAQPRFAIGYQDLCGGLKYQDGNTIGGVVVGRGSAVIRHLGMLAPDSGRGKVGHSWTVGAQAVEVEYDPRDMTYRLVNAWTAIDIGNVVDEKAAKAMIRGGMSMGLSLAKGEEQLYTQDGKPLNTSFRAYKLMHIGEEPRYGVQLVQTPQLDAPLGTRSFSEHGIIGMPAALGNALSRAAGVELNALPLTGEAVWRAVKGEKSK